MVGPRANFNPSSTQAASTPGRNCRFMLRASKTDHTLRPGTPREMQVTKPTRGSANGATTDRK